MQELGGLGMKNSLTLHSLANNFFNRLRDEDDDYIYNYPVPFRMNFVRQSIKGGRCIAFTQQYKSEISDIVFTFSS